MIKRAWPQLSYEEGKATYETLHMWTQILGKIKLATLPWMNHSWHIALKVSPTGLTTGSLPCEAGHFQLNLDFIQHRLLLKTSWGKERDFALSNLSVADFYEKLFSLLKELKIEVAINTIPSELVDPIPFEKDTVHATYNASQVQDLHKALLAMMDVFTSFRCGFKGKSSETHFFWGSFDLALSRFSGRKAPKHPGGIPNLPDWVAAEAYSHEVMSCGFWPGSETFPQAAFYAYLYPEPEGYKDAKVSPSEAYYDQSLREFILPYAAVQQASDPEKKLLEFLESTNAVGAGLANWDMESLT